MASGDASMVPGQVRVGSGHGKGEIEVELRLVPHLLDDEEHRRLAFIGLRGLASNICGDSAQLEQGASG